MSKWNRPMRTYKADAFGPVSTTRETIKTYDEIFVTTTAAGESRYHYFNRGRLWPLNRRAAELSIAGGATVIRKQPGETVWQAMENHPR